MDKEKKEKYEKLGNICKMMQKKYGKDAVTYFGSNEVVPMERISTQCDVLDNAMGGGYPLKIIEIFGPESSGKSTVCYHAIASTQKKYPKDAVVFIDVEYAFDPIYAQNLGVKVDELIITQPKSGEESLNMLCDFINSGEVKLIVVDSVAALIPQEEMESNIEDQYMGLQARMMSKSLRKINQLMGNKQVAIIFTNQTREKIGIMYGDKTTTPGGNALKFYSAIRIKLAKMNVVTEGGEKVSARVKASIVKNKTFPPFKECEFTIRFGKGIDVLDAVLTLAIENNVIEKAGAWYTYKGERYQGIADVRKFFEENVTEFEKLRENVKSLSAPVMKIDDEEKEKYVKENETEEVIDVKVETV